MQCLWFIFCKFRKNLQMQTWTSDSLKPITTISNFNRISIILQNFLVYTTPLPTRLGEHGGRGGGKAVNESDVQEYWMNWHLLDVTGPHVPPNWQQLRPPPQDKLVNIPAWNGQRLTSPSQGAIDSYGFWGGRVNFFRGVVPGDKPCSRGVPYTPWACEQHRQTTHGFFKT